MQVVAELLVLVFHVHQGLQGVLGQLMIPAALELTARNLDEGLRRRMWLLGLGGRDALLLSTQGSRLYKDIVSRILSLLARALYDNCFINTWLSFFAKEERLQIILLLRGLFDSFARFLAAVGLDGPALLTPRSLDRAAKLCLPKRLVVPLVRLLDLLGGHSKFTNQVEGRIVAEAALS